MSSQKLSERRPSTQNHTPGLKNREIMVIRDHTTCCHFATASAQPNTMRKLQGAELKIEKRVGS